VWSRIVTALVLTLALGGCAVSAQSPEPEPADTHGRARATVTHISDGDTITLSGLGKTRLIGVDTPEVYGHVDCYGPQASAFTKRVLKPGTKVTYEIGTEAHDRYGRSLAYVWLADGRMFNELLARDGYADELTSPPNVEYEPRFRAAGRDAREHDRGLWSPSACGGKEPARETTKHCSDFASRAEAQRWLDAHPDAPLDGDRDGVACESL
jgi:micrococcal nuclease